MTTRRLLPISTPLRATVTDTEPEATARCRVDHRSPRRGAPLARGAALLLAAVALVPAAWAQKTSPAQIYSCIDGNGKKLTSDRPIPECLNRDQRLLNTDGSPRGIVPPTPTADELAAQEQRDRDAAAERAAKNDAIRRDRNLLNRFSDEAAHAKARAKALDDVGNSVRISEARINLLKAERKPLLDEAEFYVGKSLPAKLKSAIDANDAALDAQKVLVQNQQLEMVRINSLYDAELARLKRLWAGAPAGSLGPIAAPSSASAQKSALNTPGAASAGNR
jgi:hypothetical protein